MNSTDGARCIEAQYRIRYLEGIVDKVLEHLDLEVDITNELKLVRKEENPLRFC